MQKVYFSQDIGKLFDKVVNEIDGNVALKVHFGEKGNSTFVKPEIVEIIFNKLKNKNIKTTLVESNVLYKGSRTDSTSHILTAKEHGFDFASIDICDGEYGEDEWQIDVNLKHFKKVKIGSHLKDYKNLIAISHFKGHMGTGFGGTLKNIGMGLGSRAGKLAMHKAFDLKINKEKCTACRICIDNCPANAITIESNKAEINKKTCIGCARCIAVCPKGAVQIPWGASSAEELQEKIVESCYGVLKNIKGIAFFNVLKDITANCDCMGTSMKPVIADIGILASTDPVALEQASFDLVNKKAGKDLWKSVHGIDATVQLKYAEKLGLGKREYELIDLS